MKTKDKNKKELYCCNLDELRCFHDRKIAEQAALKKLLQALNSNKFNYKNN